MGETVNYREKFEDLVDRMVNPPICYIDQSGLDKKILSYLDEVKRPTKAGIRTVVSKHNTSLHLGEYPWVKF